MVTHRLTVNITSNFVERFRDNNIILVTGATGQLGSAALEHLLKNSNAEDVVAFARSEEKAKPLRERGIQVRLGNFNDAASMKETMKGIEKVLLIPGIDHDRLAQHQNVIDAAKTAGVKRIVYTGGVVKDLETSAIKMVMESHYQTEDYLRQSNVSYTVLRNTLYMDMIPVYVGKNVLATGVYLPAGDGKVAFALRREMGEAAAVALLQNGDENKIYEITGSVLYSFADVARTLSELSGKDVAYTDADPAEFREKLQRLGVPDMSVLVAAGFSADIKNHQFEVVTEDLQNLLRRKPANLKASLKEIYGL